MNITTDSLQDLWHKLDDPGSYEWWYFDAEDEAQGISIVIVWFFGFAFSPYYISHYEEWKSAVRSDPPHPGNHAGFSFQLYENGRETVNFIKEGQGGLFDSVLPEIGARFEGSSFFCDRLQQQYNLTVDFEFPARRKRVQGTFSFRPRYRFDYSRDSDGFTSNSGSSLQWILSVPKAEVEGEIILNGYRSADRRELRFRGSGYHDHNLGTAPMYESIDRWYWGRAFSGRYDLIYYVIFLRGSNTVPVAVMMLNDNETGLQSVMDDVIIAEDNFRRGLFAPTHGKTLRLRNGSVSVEVRHQEVLDAGPFYLRYGSRLSMDIDGCRQDEVRGISEFLNPISLRSRIMRFFTSSRVLRDGKPSTMYIGYNFFKHQIDWLNRKIF
ncbi:MAG: carotenoid 1,2-hydratase [Chlorobiaceae bacterium]|nr:carotenoid 1,2-hydratase [Chlorobiaceae bacterium]